MINVGNVVKGYKTAEARWARFGPYYAMFPLDFAFEVVQKYSKEGDYIIDPFAGRGSSIFAGGVLGRHSLGIEINPIGWLYGTVKIAPAEKDKVIQRLIYIYNKKELYKKDASNLPVFYRMCYGKNVLKFLLSVRNNLDWKHDHKDATLMSIILVYLHGKIGESLSNQMQMTKAMGMNYSMNWWKSKNLSQPPDFDPLDFLLERIEWRYKKGYPQIEESRIVLGDSTQELSKIAERACDNDIKFRLLFTSPPYYSLTDYHKDQWLRLWLIGGPEIPETNKEKYRGRFNDKEDYCKLLDTTFGSCVPMMDKKSTIYVRTDKRNWTFNITMEILRKHFPKHKLSIVDRNITKRTQTEIFGNSSSEKGEIDIILTK
ncbi:site-specific DNA-methyltransferase [Candidatus Dojkabacteria bacterium]|nr:site-specific DNA-methyltransferase [Candidatus Dojkabacteria bacterium]